MYKDLAPKRNYVRQYSKKSLKSDDLPMENVSKKMTKKRKRPYKKTLTVQAPFELKT